MIKSLLNRLKQRSRPLKEFYTEWINSLKFTLLPLLTSSLSSTSPDPIVLATHVDLIHSHFRSYFTALDLASNDDVSQLIFPNWRNPLEKPYLWLGDFHPYIFTNLLRSFLEDDDIDENEDFNSGNVAISWKNHDLSLGHKVEQIECGLRLMVPAIVARGRDAQATLVDKLGVGWMKERRDLKVGNMVGDLVNELTCVFLDANRLRRSVLGDIMGLLNVHQAALFLEGLAQFYVGFWDPKLIDQFNNSKLPPD